MAAEDDFRRHRPEKGIRLPATYSAHKIRVNCVAPRLVWTAFSGGIWENKAKLAHALEGTPLNRIGEPEDIAGAALSHPTRRHS